MIIIFVLAILGILDTDYLSYTHLFGGQACGQGTGCSFVLSSPYTRIFGVPLSTLGLGAYCCFVFLAMYARVTRKKTDANSMDFLYFFDRESFCRISHILTGSCY